MCFYYYFFKMWFLCFVLITQDEWVLSKVCLKSSVVSRETKLISSSGGVNCSSSSASAGSLIAPMIDAYATEHVSCFSNTSAVHADASFPPTYLPAPLPPSLPRQPRRFGDDVAFGQFMDVGASGQFSIDAAFLPNLPSLPPTVFTPPSQPFGVYGGASAVSSWPFALWWFVMRSQAIYLSTVYEFVLRKTRLSFLIKWFVLVSNHVAVLHLVCVRVL